MLPRPLPAVWLPCPRPLLLLFLCLCLFPGLLPSTGSASLYQPLAAFPAGLKSPDRARLTPHPDGGLYGTLNNGGETRPGLIYRISPSGEAASAGRLMQETGQPAQLSGSLVADAAGRLWGILLNPAGFRRAVIFSFDPATGQYTQATGLDTLPDSTYLTVPQSNLVPDGQGRFLFLTGFTSTAGEWRTTLYRLDPETVKFTNLGYSTADPRGTVNLTADGAGFLWGHGDGADGPVFKIDAGTGARTVVARLDGDAPTRGRYPVADLVADGQGFLWGTTVQGGVNGVGTVFKVAVAAGVLTTVADLPVTTTDGGIKSTLPQGALCPDGRGWIWGTTSQGGDSPGSGYFGNGTVFKVNMGTGEYRTVIRFTGTGGAFPGTGPESNLVPDADGKLRGLTAGGGAPGRGTVFAIDPATDAFTLLRELTGAVPGSLAAPDTPLTEDGQGLLWGGSRFCDGGGYGCLYALNPGTGQVVRRIPFTGRAGPVRGTALSGGMARDSAGRLWGLTQEGGGAGLGTVFRLDPASGTVTTVREFTGGTDGRYPSGTPVLDGNGWLWGTTAGGYGGTGAAIYGTVFRISTVNSLLTTVTAFTGDIGAALGSAPTGGLKPDGLGYLWGTTFYGGMGSLGTVFKVDPATDGFTCVREFGTLPLPRPEHPVAPLTADGRGFMWGGTSATGQSSGKFYKINAATHEFTPVRDALPGEMGELVSNDLGWLWGTSGIGRIFRIHAETQQLQVMHALTGLGGDTPGDVPAPGALLKAMDGHLYGATLEGGALADGSPAGGGQLYRVFLGPRVRAASLYFTSAFRAGFRTTVLPNGAATDVFLEYGKKPDLTDGALTPAVRVTGNLSADQEAPLSLEDLEASTTYYYRVRAVNADNANPALGEILSFTTLSSRWTEWTQDQGLQEARSLPDADPDLDGLPNVLEYAIGGNPLDASDGVLVRMVTLDGGAPALEIHRLAGARGDPNVTLLMETSTDLETWRSFRVGGTTGTSDPGVVVLPAGPDGDLIHLAAPLSAEGQWFARVRVTYRFF